MIIKFKGKDVAKYPSFLILHLLENRDKTTTDTQEYIRLEAFGDKEFSRTEQKSILLFISKYLDLEEIEPYRKFPSNTDAYEKVNQMWKNRIFERYGYSIHIEPQVLPGHIYKYAPYDKERVEEIIKDSRLYLSCPNDFNDPFDCAFDEGVKLGFIDAGMGCFSGTKDRILMYSHYADKHKGLCYLFDSKKLARSISKNENCRTDIRVVHYLDQLPNFSLSTQPALCATCKDMEWRYEKEYRLFVSRNGKLLKAGHYQFDEDALLGVIFGCKMDEKHVINIKNMIQDRKFLFQHAAKTPNEFGLKVKKHFF